jgi:hypothetical protein
MVRTLALAEALAAAGQDVSVWTLARGGDGGDFCPVDPRVRQRLVPFPDAEGEDVAVSGGDAGICAARVMAGAARPRGRHEPS